MCTVLIVTFSDGELGCLPYRVLLGFQCWLALKGPFHTSFSLSLPYPHNHHFYKLVCTLLSQLLIFSLVWNTVSVSYILGIILHHLLHCYWSMKQFVDFVSIVAVIPHFTSRIPSLFWRLCNNNNNVLFPVLFLQAKHQNTVKTNLCKSTQTPHTHSQ